MIYIPKTMLLSPDSEKAALRIEMFVLCETAQEFGGKLNLLGTFEQIEVSSTPVLIPAMSAAMRIRFWPEEVGRHRCKLRLIDSDGSEVLNCLEAEFTVPSMGENASSVMNVVVRFQNALFECGGDYSLDLYLDASLEASLPFKVVVANGLV